MRLGGHAAFGQRPHEVFDLAQLPAQAAGRMEAGEVLAAEIAHAAGDQRQGVAHSQHGRGAGAGGQSQGDRLLCSGPSSIVTTAAARPSVLVARPVMAIIGTPNSASDGSSRIDFFGFAALRKNQHHVVAADAAQVAVHGFGRMQKVAARAGRGERGGDLLGDQAGLAHAGRR